MNPPEANDEHPAPGALQGPEPQARLWGVPVIYLALILFIIVIAILSWMGFIAGDML